MRTRLDETQFERLELGERDGRCIELPWIAGRGEIFVDVRWVIAITNYERENEPSCEKL